MAKPLPQPGDEITIRVTVTRVGRNTADTADTVTIEIPGFDTPVTAAADRLLAAAET